jgi:HEPN domain-containing protein
MDDPRCELVLNWLIKAHHDLTSARKLSTDPDPYLDTAIYHCQQAAEKAVKGFLVFHNQRFERTHDIEVLLALAIPFAPPFAAWVEAAERLTRYATQFRYPGFLMEPDAAEFAQALADAESMYALVASLLPPDVRP